MHERENERSYESRLIQSEVRAILVEIYGFPTLVLCGLHKFKSGNNNFMARKDEALG